MSKPIIASLKIEIESLRARVLDADQCAARALEGRDNAFAELEAFKRHLKGLPPVDSQVLINLRRVTAALQGEVAALRIRVRVLKLQHALFKLKNKAAK